MKICPNCKAQLEDDVVFCNECGTKLDDVKTEAPKNDAPAADNTASPAGNSVLEAAQQTAKNSSIGIIAVAIVALVVVVILIAALAGGGGGAKSAIKGYFAALQKGDTSKLLGYVVPKKGLEDYVDDYYDADLDDYIKAYDELYDTMWAGFKNEGKINLEYEIKTIENIKKLDKLKKEAKAWDVKDLEDFQDMVDDYLDDYGVEGDKVKEVYIAEVKYTLEVDGKKILKDDGIVFIYKYAGNWYMAGGLPDAYDILSEIYYDSKLEDDFEDVMSDCADVYDDYDDELSSLWFLGYY